MTRQFFRTKFTSLVVLSEVAVDGLEHGVLVEVLAAEAVHQLADAMLGSI
jgi:hypothetical protein